ncbi:sensor histidine kinase [Citreicella sp. C3M06]|uniref:ATP-binding protein n=1 Tax=Citreicella sp. C3M06 TaxID=2841564 RepID=UPI001C0873F6|nr:sensor histidine kinase [Citreicella sp. C3M06]
MSRPDFFPEVERVDGTRSKTKFRLLTALVALVFIFDLVLLAVADHRRSEARAQQQLRHFAELFEQSLDASLAVANLEMWAMIDDISYVPLRNKQYIEQSYGRRMRRAMLEIEQIDSLVLLSTDGTVMWSTAEGLLGMNLADRAYFANAITLSRGEYTVGSPITSRANSRHLTPIAWPVISRSGELRGVVASSLGAEYFGKLLSLQDVGDDMIVRLVTADGASAFAIGPEEAIDTSQLMTATRPLPEVGLRIEVSRTRKAVMRTFWERTIIFGLITSALSVIVLVSVLRTRAQSVKLASALKQSELDRMKIQATQREFDAIFENVGDGIVVFDDLGTLHRSNLAARQFLNAKDDESAVNCLRNRLPLLTEIPKETAVIPLSLPQTGCAETPQTMQCRVMKLQLYGAEIAYCVLEDISAQERLSETRMSFITSVNHELRTPLTSLSGALDLLRDRFGAELPAGASKLVSMATRNADRLLVLVNDILTLQAIDQNQLLISLEPIRVSDALCDAVQTNAGYGLGRNVTIAADPLPDGEDAIVMLDPIRLQQILSNLVSNAIKYSPQGSQVRIGAELLPDSVRFYVTDRGPGIPSDALGRLFERFGKPIHGRDLQASGTGLGLAITRELVQRQGGEISVTSRSQFDGAQDTGTTFHIRFPRHTKDTGHTT